MSPLQLGPTWEERALPFVVAGVVILLLGLAVFAYMELRSVNRMRALAVALLILIAPPLGLLGWFLLRRRRWSGASTESEKVQSEMGR